jgi:HAD superfamily hydrolase (TIGR01509 family)
MPDCRRLAAIIWDFDGTLVDTETPQYEAWAEVFRTAGATLTLTDWSRFVGTVPELTLAELLEQRVGRARRLEAERLSDRLAEPRLAVAPLCPGVRPLLRAARQHGVRLAIASSSPRAWVLPHLRRHGIEEHFETVAAGDDVAAVKPDPALYLLVLERLGCPADRVLAIEDSPHGALAARAAGLTCLVVPNPTTANLVFPPGIVRRPTLEGVTLSDLESLLKVDGAGEA